MKKRVLATMLTVCLLFSVMACMASAANVTVGEIIVSKRICPGDVIDFDFIERPAIEGGVFSEGWEILSEDDVWIPYDGEPIDKYDDGATIRYYACNEAGDYSYSNECIIAVAHNPIGSYKSDGMNHWRECNDCGGQAQKGAHTHLDEGMDEAAVKDNICKVCGHKRTPQYTGIKAFLAWVMALITSLIG